MRPRVFIGRYNKKYQAAKNKGHAKHDGQLDRIQYQISALHYYCNETKAPRLSQLELDLDYKRIISKSNGKSNTHGSINKTKLARYLLHKQKEKYYKKRTDGIAWTVAGIGAALIGVATLAVPGSTSSTDSRCRLLRRIRSHQSKTTL